MYCPNCGAQLNSGAKFCSECGQSIESAKANEQGQNENVRVYPRQTDNPERIRYVMQPQEQPKKHHGFIWFIIILLIAAIAFLYLSPRTRNLYVCSKIQILADYISEEDRRGLEDEFGGSYLFQDEDGKYAIVDLESGMGFSLSDFQDEMPSYMGLSIKVSGKYAVIEINYSNSNDRIIISYFKASLLQRAKFISRFH